MRINDLNGFFNKETILDKIKDKNIDSSFNKELKSELSEYSLNNFSTDKELKKMFDFFNEALSIYYQSFIEDKNTKPIKNPNQESFELPKDYKDQIKNAVEEASKLYNIPKNLIYAIIKKESDFNPFAYNKNKDDTEDYGIMQVNFLHNKALMEEFGIKDPSELFDIKTNILLGTKILSDNYKKYKDWRLAIKAYNGINADNWDYVKDVLNNYAKLQEKDYVDKLSP